jgi:hypothetical protein
MVGNIRCNVTDHNLGVSAPKVDIVTLSLLLFEGITFLTVKHEHSVLQRSLKKLYKIALHSSVSADAYKHEYERRIITFRMG